MLPPLVFILGATGVATLSSGGTTKTFALNYRVCNRLYQIINTFWQVADLFWTFWGPKRGAEISLGARPPGPLGTAPVTYAKEVMIFMRHYEYLYSP